MRDLRESTWAKGRQKGSPFDPPLRQQSKRQGARLWSSFANMAASVPAVFASESAAGSFIRARIAKGTTVHADESGARDGLHERFEMSASTIKRRTASTALAPIKQRNISAACGVPRSAFTVISQVRICSATRRKVHGVRTTAGRPLPSPQA
jgi:hypothetical protein